MAEAAALRDLPPTAGLPLRALDLWPDRTRLEDGLATWLGLTDPILTWSGTAALLIALTTLKALSDRRIVVLPAYTCPLVASAVLQAGLRPVVCDLAPGGLDMDAGRLAELLTDEVLCVVPTHLGGRVVDVAPLAAVARSRGIVVIEDAAQAMGARRQGRPVGTLGDIGLYSLGVGKGLTLYGGGVLTAQTPRMRRELAQTARRMASFSPLAEAQRIVELIGYGLLYRPGLGLRLAYGAPLRRHLAAGRLIEAVGDEDQAPIAVHRVGRWRAGVGASALRRLPAFLNAGRARAKARLARLARLTRIAGVTVMTDRDGDEGVWPFLQVVLPDTASRDAVLAELWPAGLGVGRLYLHALPDYDYLRDAMAGQAAPNARDYAARLLEITHSPFMTEAQFERICQTLERRLG